MSIFGKLTEQYSELWKAVIRPPRDIYEKRDLGPTVFSIEGRTFQRTDLTLKNPRGLRLVCSHFEPIICERVAAQLPCVIYLHGNCSSRLEAVSSLPVLLPFNITVFCLDFAGSGLSEGEYLSLGYYERDDLAAAVKHLRASHRVTCIGLWGRSMGASTALLHADRDSSIAGLVLDSPFSDLRVLCEELVDFYTNSTIPRFVVRMALEMVRSSISQHGNFDIYDLAPIQHVKNCCIPALFAAADKDNFILPHHAKELYELFAGEKTLVMVEGDHNSSRSKYFMDSIAIFFFNALQCDRLPQRREPRILPLPPKGLLHGSAGAQDQAKPKARPEAGNGVAVDVCRGADDRRQEDEAVRLDSEFSPRASSGQSQWPKQGGGDRDDAQPLGLQMQPPNRGGLGSTRKAAPA